MKESSKNQVIYIGKEEAGETMGITETSELSRVLPLSNVTYDRLKWLVLIFLPALAVFLKGLADVYSWTQIGEWVAGINLFTIFLGSLLQVSTKYYHEGGK